MSTTAKHPDLMRSPVPLAETEVNAFSFPDLSMPKRGPKCTLGYHMTKPFSSCMSRASAYGRRLSNGR
jgi:hypothetical protein